MLSGTSEMSEDSIWDSQNNVFKPFGQRDSGFSLLLYYFICCPVGVRIYRHISANGLDFMFVKRYNDEVEVCHKPE